MAELVGGALLSGFLNVLFKRMISKEIVGFFRGKKAISKLLKELKIRLISADALLNDAEEKQLKNREIKEWLEQLKGVIYESDHVMDKINTEALWCEIEDVGGESKSTRAKCLNCLRKPLGEFDRAVKVEFEEILETLKLLLEQSDHLGLTKGNKRSSSVVRSLAPLVEESDVFGREAEKKALIKLLLSDDVRGPKISVIPIVGMGGIGKTTLAQIVYNNSRVQGHFDSRSWVTVSDDFDVSKLTKTIFESITSTKCDTEDPYELQSKLKVALSRKKFLFVHDDVWNEKYELWDLLRSSFESGAHGSKIIVTTRSEIVALQMGNVKPFHLGTISKDDCWELFTKHVFNGVDSEACSDLRKIGIEIVGKCKGLPLAVKSIAGLLRSVTDRESWRKVLESEIWELELQPINGTNILPALWLSYSFLPPQLKRCFAFLSIFPKDYEFRLDDRERVIFLWMAEGILNVEDHSRRPEDVGKEYLNNLILRSFFQRSAKDKSILSMHDLMHDLAMFVSGCFHGDSSKTRHLSCGKHSKGIDLSNKKFLRVILSLPLMRYDELLREKLFPNGEYLRALSLSNDFSVLVSDSFGYSNDFTPLLPDSIGNLKNLRYLDLSGIEMAEIPSSVCKLYNLQSILLRNCKALRKLPNDMFHLISLRHLDISNTSLKEMPPKMCNMKNLQTLSHYVVGEESGFRVKDLGEMQLLHGRFHITKLQNIAQVEDVSRADLKNKKYLTDLILEWDGKTDQDSEKEFEVLNALKPHSELKNLKILGYGGAEFPSWVGHRSFSEMVKVTLKDCNKNRSLPPFGQLPSLKELNISRMNGVTSIGDEFCGATLKPFPSLERLTFYELSSWKEWSFSNNSEKEEGAVIFPRLKDLEITYCNSLIVGLPEGRLPALETLFVSISTSIAKIFPTTTQSLHIDTAYPLLESMAIKYCRNVESFPETGLPIALERLHIWGCKMLISSRLSWGLQRLSSLQTLNLYGSAPHLELGDSFPEEGLIPSTLVRFHLEFFENMKSLNGKGLRQLTSLQELSIRYCTNIERLPDEGMLPASLTSLSVENCGLLTERCQRGSGQDWPKIQHVPQIFVDRKQI